MIDTARELGQTLAERLGLRIIGRDGHNAKCACIACSSSDGFRVHRETGVAHCHVCKIGYSRLQLATKMLGDEQSAWRLLEEIGLEQPPTNGNGHHNGSAANVLAIVARAKGVTPEALTAFGAKIVGSAVVFPMYGPDGNQCSTFTLKPGGGKGLCEKGKPSGLFFPHDEAGNIRLPASGEKWHIVEGPKDAAALHSLGQLACGLPSSALGAKFARLFAGAYCIMVPDLDTAGKNGADKSASRLYGRAAAVYVARLPGEFSDTKGADVRDALKQPGGCEAVLQALGCALEWKPQIATGESGGLWDPKERTDQATARRIVALHGQNIRWCDPWGKWLVWDGNRFKQDGECRIAAIAKTTADEIWRDVAELLPKADREMASALVSFGKRTASANGQRDALILARSEPGIAILPEAMDTDAWLLNCFNGTVKLRSGELLPHDRANCITKLLPHDYVQGAEGECPRWEDFLSRIFDRNTGMIGFVQRLFGSALVGQVVDHILPILHGAGANGKSVLIETLLHVFGPDYACKAVSDLLLSKSNNSHPTERADLHGKRFVACVETDENRQLAEGLVKELTGGDTIKARRMREDFWSFKPSHTAVLVTNHRPEVAGTDNGMWRRLRLIPFTVTIPPDEQDKLLTEKLQAEAPGILRWLVDGCLAWQRDGLGEPAEVVAATAEYRDAMDVVAEFIAERCIVNTAVRVKAGKLHEAYVEWCDGRHEKPKGHRTFAEAILKRFTRHVSNGKWYIGVALLDQSDGQNGRVDGL